LKLALGEKRRLASFIVICTLGLAVGLFQGCSGVGTAFPHPFSLRWNMAAISQMW